MTAKTKSNFQEVLKYIIPIIIGGGAGYGTSNVETAVLKEQVKQLQEEKEVLFKTKGSQKDIDRLLSQELKNAERIAKLEALISK